MPDTMIGLWRGGESAVERLPRGRHDLSREEVLASQKGRIMRSALHELAATGAHSMKISDVVAGARVSKRTFYAHFDSMEECMAQALQTLNVVAGTEMARAADDADPSEPFGRLRAVVTELLESAAEEPVLTTALLGTGYVLERPSAEAWLLYGEVRAKMLKSWYDDERNRTPSLPQATLTTAFAAFAAFEYAILRDLAAGKGSKLPARAGEITDLLVGILSSAAS